MDKSQIWSNILQKIEPKIDSLIYKTYFEDTSLYDIKNGVATIIVPYAIYKEHLAIHYKKLITNCFIEEIGEQLELEFLISEEIESIKEEINPSINDETFEKKQELITNHETFLNKKYTFDNFIVGNSNKFAHDAALFVAKNPCKSYNPLFIYGNSGLGKTHLMHAIGNYICNTTNKKVLYVTSETFVTEFVEVTKKHDNKNNFEYIDFFKQKYRNIDVLIIDDIQYLAGATESQKEFFHTFNNLYGDNKQIIISSDRSPNDLKVFEDRLRTRFGWGLPVNIFPPDIELKKEILRKKILGEHLLITIEDDVIEYMANIVTDIRQLEGCLNRLIAFSTMMGQDIDLDLAVDALKDYINKGYSEKNDISRVQKIVADYFKISIEDLKSKKRNADIAFPRQIAMYLCRKIVGETFPKIGIEFGGKDHSTVMHSCEKIELETRTNSSFRETIEKLENDIKNK